MSTPSETPTSTSTQTSDPYFDFALECIQQLDAHSSVPVQIRGASVHEDVLWVVINSTSPSKDASKLLSERNSVANAYARTYQIYQDGYLDGQQPSGLRYIEVNASNTETPKTFKINNSVVRDYVSSDQTFIDYRKQWSKTVRNRTASEARIAQQIDRDAENGTV